MSRIDTFDLETTHHVALAREGDAASMEWIIEHLTPALRLQARHRLAASPVKDLDPDDLVQEVWAVAWPRVRELRPRDGRLTPVLVRFLAGTLVRRYGNHLQTRLRRGRPEPLPTDAVAESVTAAMTRITRRESLAELEGALAALAPDERALIVLHGIEGQSWAALAERRGESPGTLSSRYSRALARLRETLDGATVFDLL